MANHQLVSTVCGINQDNELKISLQKNLEN